jgi:two-component system chemotaxis sensor kinase CheA
MHDDVYQEFINEAEESIDDLNNALLELESNPDDRDAMDRIFRRAHTLKGNFGAMGFASGATLAHAVEDLLDDVRDDELAVTPALMDLVFAGVDRLEAIVADIEATGTPETEVDDVVDQIRAVLDGETVVDSADGDPTPTDPATGPSAVVPEGVREAADGGPVVRATVTLQTGEMKGVDAGLFLGDLPADLPLYGTTPDSEALEAGEFDETVALYAAPVDDLAATLEGCWGVTGVEVTTVEADGTPDAVAGGEAESGAESGGGRAFETDTEADTEAGPDADGSTPKRASNTTVRSVRIDVGQLDELHELAEQLVTSRIKLRRVVDATDDRTAADAMDELEKISTNLQNTVMNMRLIPLRKVVSKFPRLVRDLARSQDKQIDLVIAGDDIELDRTILDEIADPLMHVLRNAADHGIEPPDDREMAGKPRTGTIELTATREQDHVVVEVRDDGGGIDADAIREKAAERGLHSPAELESMEDSAVHDLVFHPGFSTADEVTDVSGRGVGMDVVRTTVRKLDGNVSVDSTPGEGTLFTIRLPVSVAIIRILLVEVGGQEFGLPVSSVDEVLQTERVHTVNGREVLSHEDRVYPLVHLNRVLGDGAVASGGDGGLAADGGVRSSEAAATSGGMLVRIKPTERPVALHCDRVTQQEEVVVKPFEGPLHDVEGLSGAAVIGDGKVIPILDVATLPSSQGEVGP